MVAVPGSADGLARLLWILVDNAAKYTPPNGHIRVELATEATWACLSVHDDGVGIPGADLRRIFERFYQVDRARSTGGAGLGLAIADWIVREHGGHLSASNNAWGGASFRVRLPLVADARDEPPFLADS